MQETETWIVSTDDLLWLLDAHENRCGVWSNDAIKLNLLIEFDETRMEEETGELSAGID